MMKNFILALILALFALPALATPPQPNQDAFKQYYKNFNGGVYELAGVGYGHVRTDIPGDEGETYWCFGGLEVYDKKSGALVGTGVDCLGQVVDNNGAVTVGKGFTFFDFFGPNGTTYTLYAGGPVSVQPVTTPTKTSWGLDVTHITGSSIDDDGVNNTCKGGSGPFDGAECVSRISGMVNMSNMDPNDIPNSTITFSCIFVIESLELQQWAIDNAAANL